MQQMYPSQMKVLLRNRKLYTSAKTSENQKMDLKLVHIVNFFVLVRVDTQSH